MKHRWNLLTRFSSLILLIGSICTLWWAKPALAGGAIGNGTPATCTGQALTAAVSSGGAITFNCGPNPHTIPVGTLVIASGRHVTIDGGNQVTLSGGDVARLFVVQNGGELTLSRITLADGFVAGNGGAIWNQGTLTLADATLRASRADGADAAGGAIFNENGLFSMQGGAILGSQAGTGGGIANAGGTVVLDGVRVEGNQAQSFSGIANDGALSLLNSVVDNNVASAVSGYGGGIGHIKGTISIQGSTIVSNSSSSYFGGGVAVMAGSATIEQSQILSNTAGLGGGGLYVHPNGDARVVVRDSRVEYNATLSGDSNVFGGGLYNGKELALERVSVSHNRSTSGAGLMNTPNAADLSLREVSFADNTATGFGGGLWLSGGSVPRLANVTISGNSAGLGGGGLFNSDVGAALENVTLFGNGAPAGANLYDQNTSTVLRNTILAAPVDGANCGFGAGAPPLTSGGHNLASDGSCSLGADGDRQNTDPLLGALTDNGSLPAGLAMLTHLPQPGSPAIDAGDAASCPPADQRGYARPGGNGCDAGAVEADAAPPQVVVPTPIVMPTPQATPIAPPPAAPPDAELLPPDFVPAVVDGGVQATIGLNPNHGYAEQRITVSGQAPAGYDQVRITSVRDGQTAGMVVAQVVNGSYSFDFLIPPDAAAGPVDLCAAVVGAANAQLACTPLQVDAPPLVAVSGILPAGISSVGPAAIRLHSLTGTGEYVANIGTNGAFALSQVPAGAYSYSLDGQLSKPVASGSVELPFSQQSTEFKLEPALECAIAGDKVGFMKASATRSGAELPFGIFVEGISNRITFEAFPQANGPIERVYFEVQDRNRKFVAGGNGHGPGWQWEFDVSQLPPSSGGRHATLYATPYVAGKPGCPIWHDIEVIKNPFPQVPFQPNPVIWDGAARIYQIRATMPYIRDILPAEYQFPEVPLFGRFDNRLNMGIQVKGWLNLDGYVHLSSIDAILEAKLLNQVLLGRDSGISLLTIDDTLPLAAALERSYSFDPCAVPRGFPRPPSCPGFYVSTPFLKVPVASFFGILDVTVNGSAGVGGSLQLTGEIWPLVPGLATTLLATGRADAELGVGLRLLMGLAEAGATAKVDAKVDIPLTVAVNTGEPPVSLGACLEMKFTVRAYVEALYGGFSDSDTQVLAKFPPDNQSGCVTLLPATAQTADADPSVPELIAAPAIAVAPSGLQLSAYVEDTAPAGEPPRIQVVVRFKAPDAATWGEPAPVTDPAHTAHTPVVAFVGPNQTPLVAWTENTLTAAEADALGDDLNAHLRRQEIAYSTWNGTAWSAPIFVTDDLLADGLPTLAGSEAGAVLAWTRDLDGDAGTRDDQRIAVTIFDPAAGQFGPVDLLTAPGGGLNGDVRAAYDQSIAPAVPYLVWVHDADASLVTADDRTLAVATYTDGAWVLLDTHSLPPRVDSPAVSAGADGVHLAYLVRAASADGNIGLIGTNGLLWTAVLQDGEWQTEAVSGEGAAPVYAEQPVLATRGGETLLLFRRFGETTDNSRLGQIALTQLTAAGAFAEPLYLTDDPRQNWQPALAINPQTGAAAILKVARATAAVAAASVEAAAAIPTTPSGGEALVAAEAASLIANGDPVDTLTVAATADPALDPLIVSTASPAPGQVVTVTVTVRNVGRGVADGVAVALFTGKPGSGALVTSAKPSGALSFNDTYTVRLPLTASGGEQSIFAELTTGGQNGSTANDRAAIDLGQLAAPQIAGIIESSEYPNALMLGWATPPTMYARGFRILRGASPTGPFELVGEASVGGFSDTLVERGRAYCYAVQAFNANSRSPLSPAVCGSLPLAELYLPLIRR